MSFDGYCKCGHHRDRHERDMDTLTDGECGAEILASVDGSSVKVLCACLSFDPSHVQLDSPWPSKESTPKEGV